MSNDLDAEIASARATKSTLTDQAEQAAREFMRAATEFLRNYYWQKTERVVKSVGEVTKTLGVEKLRELKADVKALQDKAEEIVNTRLNRDDLWRHRKSGPQSYESYTRPPEILDDPIRIAAMELAQVLQKCGYPAQPTVIDRTRGMFWDENWGWSTAMNSALENYKTILQQIGTANYNLEQLEAKKRRNEAEDLWNQA